ncbi:short-chain dehydrogenase [Polymorphobacter glacialis]|uniref:Short-chain dehydrogenase n=1 Tax=Sandarakinorhabdus glacialis TaxID=1614636 RepID=A0A916ZVL3_9SPHN|nr:SDR family oxidoreductase [Polymorphobacter glacialis]GGE13652.1 short-chain dehydrogenase [Polymorphobacter glacialis]
MSTANGRKSIFITGAASGIGRQVALLFAGKGWFVGGFDVQEDLLAKLAGEIGAENCLVRRLDVTDRVDYAAAIAAFSAATGGRMDMLHNNAGIGKGGPFADQPFEDVLALVQVNFVGVLNGIHLAVPLLKATENSMCFTTSSSSATFGMPGIAVYSATKHAVKGLSEALSIEFKALGIRVADVLPGLIDTPIIPREAIGAASKEGMFRPIPPIEVAQAVWEAYHSDKLHWYVPPEIAALDRMATLEPEKTRDSLASGGILAFLETEGRDAG